MAKMTNKLTSAQWMCFAFAVCIAVIVGVNWRWPPNNDTAPWVLLITLAALTFAIAAIGVAINGRLAGVLIGARQPSRGPTPTLPGALPPRAVDVRFKSRKDLRSCSGFSSSGLS